jgi:hypothetical protein
MQAIQLVLFANHQLAAKTQKEWLNLPNRLDIGLRIPELLGIRQILH